MDQLVIGRAEQLVSGARPKPAFIDQALGVLDPKPDRKWFGFNINAALMQHVKRVTRAVADGQDDMPGTNKFTVCQSYTAHPVLLDLNIFNLALKPDLAAECGNRRSHLLDDHDQFIGSDMRFVDKKDFRRRA